MFLCIFIQLIIFEVFLSFRLYNSWKGGENMKKSIVFLLVISILISVCGCKSAPTGLSSGKNIQKEFMDVLGILEK